MMFYEMRFGKTLYYNKQSFILNVLILVFDILKE